MEHVCLQCTIVCGVGCVRTQFLPSLTCASCTREHSTHIIVRRCWRVHVCAAIRPSLSLSYIYAVIGPVVACRARLMKSLSATRPHACWKARSCCARLNQIRRRAAMRTRVLVLSGSRGRSAEIFGWLKLKVRGNTVILQSKVEHDLSFCVLFQHDSLRQRYYICYTT